MLIRILSIIFILLISSCAYYSQMTVPGESVIRSDSEVIAHIEDSENGFRFLTLPVTIPSSSNIIMKNLESNQGNGIKNLEVTFSEFNLGIISFPSVKVKFDIIKVTTGNQNVAHLSDKSESQSAENKELVPVPTSSAQIETSTKSQNIKPLDEWQIDISKLLDNELYKEWWYFGKKHKINVSASEWSKTLNINDYQQYLDSGLELNEWLKIRLKK